MNTRDSDGGKIPTHILYFHIFSVYLQTGKTLNKLDEESVRCLDKIRVASADLDVRPYDWEVNGKVGRTAYLQSIKVIQDVVDRFAEDYDNRE